MSGEEEGESKVAEGQPLQLLLSLGRCQLQKCRVQSGCWFTYSCRRTGSIGEAHWSQSRDLMPTFGTDSVQKRDG